MFEILSLFVTVSLLICLYIVWTVFVDVHKLYRIRRAIERGEQLRLYLRNNHRDMPDKLKELERLAKSLGRPMTVVTRHGDKDFPDLITGFDVTVG